MEKRGSLSIPHNAKQWCFHTYIILSFLASLTWGRSLMSLQVPQNAQPGHVVTVLPTSRGWDYTLRDPHDGTIAKHFSVMQQGQLITNSDVSHLGGQSVYLFVENMHPLEPWSQMLSLDFSAKPNSLYFEGQPYEGRIVENQLPETPVTGLENLYDSINNFPSSVNMSIVSGDVDDFKIVYSPSSHVGILVSTVEFDRENKSCYHIVLKAEDVNAEAYAIVTIHVEDDNDNAPAFLDTTFFGMIPMNADPMTQIMQVMAHDLDLDDIISYVLEEESDLFHLLQDSGDIFLMDPAALQPQSYELSILAVDDKGAKSEPATVRLEVESPESHQRSRRAVQTEAVFVINITVTFGDLFHVAGLNPIEEEQYAFTELQPMFTIHMDTGMVSLVPGASFEDGVMEYSMEVNITRTDDPTYSEILSVKLVRVSRGIFDSIFVNEPQPITLLVPTWIRPYTPLIELEAIDEVEYGAEVVYNIESGADERFRINSVTGEISTFGRFPYTCSDETAFELAVSANVVGVPSSITTTPAQVVTVYCDLRPPQFYNSPMNFTIDEMMGTNDVVLTIQAKSFFEIEILYTIMNRDGSTSNDFTIGLSNGEMRARRQLNYAFDPHQYQLTVTAREPASGFSTTEDLTINLKDINNYVPEFPPAMYVALDISEDVSVGTSLVDVFVTDLDSGALGEVTFSVDNELFTMTTNADGKSGTLKTMGQLDYDRLPERKYEVIVTAVDGGDPPNTGTGTVQVWMANVNDEAPVFSPPVQEVWLKKSLTNTDNPVVYVVQFYDLDGDRLTFKFVGGTSATRWGPFELDTNTGAIRLVAPLSEQEQKYYLHINATDTGSCCVNNGAIHETNGTVVIDFADVNRPPKFPLCDQYTPSLPENSEAQTSVLSFQATDDDAGSNGELTYELIVTYPNPEYFGIREVPGTDGLMELYTEEIFDRENPAPGYLKVTGKIAYPVTIRAVDNGRYPLSATCFLLVTIDDVNDYIPEFDDNSYFVGIPFTAGPSSQVMRVFAWDRDEGDNAFVNYKIRSESPNACSGSCFKIDEITGWISIVNSIPSSNTLLTMVVEAWDPLGSPMLPDVATVNVTVNRTSSQMWLPPQWQQVGNIQIDDFVATIEEDYPVQEIIAQVFTATSMRPSEDVSYYIQRGLVYELNFDELFVAYQAQPGMQIEVNQALDYEKSSMHILQMRASYYNLDLNLRSLARPQINLIDVNDNRPQWYGVDSDGRFPASIEEDAVFGAYVTTVFAVDQDGTSPNNRVSYYFADECNTDCDQFAINENSGQITKNIEVPFDRTVQSQYTLKVIAMDGDPLVTAAEDRRRSTVIAVQVGITGASLNPPEFPSDQYTANIDAGNYIDQLLIQIEADYNLDDGDTYPQYAIISGNDDRLFYVDSNSGQIYIVGTMNYTNGPYILGYRVFDGLKFDETTLTVSVNYVNIYPPQFSMAVYPDVTNIVEGGSQTDIFMVDTHAVDPENTNIVYGLDGQFYLDDTSRFTVNSDGVVWLKQGLDRDYPYGHANWQINVAADDEGGSSSKQRGYAVVNLLLQDINDNAPIFDTCCLIGTILEGPTTGVAGLQVFANDYDAGNNAQVTYSLVNSDEFYIESYTGIIRNSVSLDRETVPQYTVTVRATDGGIPSLTTEAEVIINVGDDNDHAPVFDPTEYVITMPENQPIGSSVTTVYATDADIGYNALLTYEVQPSAYSGYFYMDSIQAAGTGVVKINQVVDYDEAMVRQLSIQIKVSDPKPGNSAVATLSITVTDVNDNAPVIVPSDNTVVINEDAAVGESVAEFSATDIDEGVNAEFEYFINYADSDPYKNFAITTNDQNAVVTVRNALDRELTESFTLEILAIDRGEPPMTGTAILTVLVGDLNEHAPELDLPTYPPVVPRNPGSNQLIAELEVTDRDGPENGPPFTLIPCQSTNPGCSDFNFQLTGANNNVLQVRTRKSSYSRESFSAYSIPVVLKDNPLSGLASKTGTTMLTVIIEDVNDNPHSPSSKTINIFNYKGSYMDIYIGHVYVEDLDDWDRAEKTYEFVLDHSGFELRSFGDIYMVAAVPEGTKKLSVRVTDAMFGSVVTEVIVKITWLDDDAVYSSGSLRLTDITAKEFVEATTLNGALVSKFELMRNILGTNLGTAAENVDIFSVRDVPDLERTVDIRYSAHGSPYYRSARLNGIMLNNLEKMQTDLGITIAMVPVDECSLINCFDAGCTNTLITESEPLLVNTNQTSLVGINSYIEASCTCGARNFSDIGENPQECDALSCLNGGTCEATISGDVKCVCPAGFDGPRCQQLRHSFTGLGWAWYNPLEQCESDILSLEFTTLALNGLILYNGPWPNSADNDDFISIEMQDGYPKVRMDLGDGGVSMTVDGRNSQGVRKLSALNDGAWHTLHIFKEGMELRMIVDYCVSSEITETLNTTSEDRASCEATATVPGDRFVLRLSTPLELGGRSNPNVDYPSGLTSNKFNGCIKNLQHNGILYDLHIGNVGEDLNTQDGCPREDNNCGTIPTNSTCSVGLVTPPFGSNYWTCNPGYTGQNCDIESTVKNMETTKSFMEWYMNSAYNSTLSSDYNSLQLMFRTRQENGLVFSSGSFSTLERLRIEIVDSYLQLRYDLGSDDMFLSLPYVNVSDGLWHTVYVYRHGNQVVLKLDGGEGRYFAEAAPVEAHRTIVLGNESFAGADVIYRRFWSDPEIKDSFQDSCIKDIRYNSLEFPMLEEDNSNAVGILLLRDEQTQVNCNSSGCFGVTCLSPLVCIDAWRLGVCLCPVGMFPVDTAEHCVDACLNHQCSYGVCIATSATSYRCDCEDGYSGDLCNQAAVVAVALATDALIAIIISLLLLLLLIILIFVIFRYRRKDPLLLEVDPEDDIRDNVVNYEEEGAGEEDMLAFDITRLQKPVDPDADSMGPDKPMRRDMMPPLGRAPEGMPPNYPSMGPDGKHPNIGDFIDDRMGDADDDPNAPPYDSVREYQYEGSGSQAGSLSSLNSSSTDGDQDYDYLNNWGPQFSKLADLYAGGNDEDDDTSSV